MNVNDLKPGDKVRITHARKGTFEAEIKSNDPDSEWLSTIVLSKKVEGLVNNWLQGEELSVRKTLIQKITSL